MSDDDREIMEFFIRYSPMMVPMSMRQGAAKADAEDAASALIICIIESWPHWKEEVRHKEAYLYRCMTNRLKRIWEQPAIRQKNEARWAHDPLSTEPRYSAADLFMRVREFDAVREWLAMLPPRQREVAGWLCLLQWAGRPVADVAQELGIATSTIRSHRRYTRKIMDALRAGEGEGEDHRRWMAAGERIHQEFHEGNPGPFGPRPLIGAAWVEAMHKGVKPTAGADVVFLDRDELKRRRERSAVPSGSPFLAELNIMALRHGMLSVVLDAESHVLHRGGQSSELGAADKVGFMDGAVWDLEHAGANAAGASGHYGVPITVSRWEHSLISQHKLCCAAVPVHLPQGRSVTINLTSSASSMTSVPRALFLQLLDLARRLRREEWKYAHSGGG